MARYIHSLPDWPRFRWDADRLSGPLAAVRYDQGLMAGRMESLGLASRQEALLGTLTEDVVRSSAIEGERLDAEQVRSSIARRLGIDIGGLKPSDRHVDGVVDMMLDATRHYDESLTAERLFGWHVSLLPSRRSGMRRIIVGAWRDDGHGPMRVVSGPIGRERVHFEAPPARRVGAEMRAFLDWFNGTATADWVLRSALAHLWLLTIHPFEDGNGRIARAVADMALARSERGSQRFYSMSAQIQAEREGYYGILERTQKATMEVTPWLEWFLACLRRAIGAAQADVSTALARARFWQVAEAGPLNDRQRRVLARLLEGFEGKLTTSKWAKLAKCSTDTALRDIQALVARGLLVQGPAGGRSTSYEVVRMER